METMPGLWDGVDEGVHHDCCDTRRSVHNSVSAVHESAV